MKTVRIAGVTDSQDNSYRAALKTISPRTAPLVNSGNLPSYFDISNFKSMARESYNSPPPEEYSDELPEQRRRRQARE